MANSFELANKYLPMLDEVYKVSSITSILDVPSAAVQYAGANEVKIYKMDVPGLGNYDRNTGFVDGDATGTWETMKLTQDRGRSFSVDRMDNEETLDMAFGTLAGEFVRTKVTPEIDAYRFATYASADNVLSASAALSTGANAVAAIDTAVAAMDDAEVPAEGRILFATPTLYKLLKANNSAVNRFATMSDRALNRDFDVYDGMRVIKVPQNRFYTAIDLRDGTSNTEGGYEKNGEGVAINFMIIHPSSVLQIVKHTLPRIFDPDTNQKMDAWKFDYRIYHDAFTYENKRNGIYVHKAV